MEKAIYLMGVIKAIVMIILPATLNSPNEEISFTAIDSNKCDCCRNTHVARSDGEHEH